MTFSGTKLQRWCFCPWPLDPNGGAVAHCLLCKGRHRIEMALRLRHMRLDPRSVIIGALLVVIAVLGYLYWERQRNTVEIKLPSITIEKH